MSDSRSPNNSEAPYPSGPAKRRSSSGTILLGFGAGLVLFILLLIPAVRYAHPGAARAQCSNNLKLIGLGLHSYREIHGAFPPAYTVDADGRPLHSWRTLILPYIGLENLYDKIDLSKPWNHPANAEALQTEVSIYRCPTADSPENHTHYLAVVAPGSCLQPSELRRMSEISDGSSHTLLVIEVPSDQSVPWMAPQDADEKLLLSFGPDSQLTHPRGVMALLADGSVTLLPADLPTNQRRAMMTIARGEVVTDDH